jgi:hypothetical protein
LFELLALAIAGSRSDARESTPPSRVRNPFGCLTYRPPDAVNSVPQVAQTGSQIVLASDVENAAFAAVDEFSDMPIVAYELKCREHNVSYQSCWCNYCHRRAMFPVQCSEFELDGST